MSGLVYYYFSVVETMIDVELVFSDELPPDTTAGEILTIFKNYVNETDEMDEFDFSDTIATLSGLVYPGDDTPSDSGNQLIHSTDPYI